MPRPPEHPEHPVDPLGGEHETAAAARALAGIGEAWCLLVGELARTLQHARPDLDIPDPPQIPSATADPAAAERTLVLLSAYRVMLVTAIVRAGGGVGLPPEDAGRVHALIGALDLLGDRYSMASRLLNTAVV